MEIVITLTGAAQMKTFTVVYIVGDWRNYGSNSTGVEKTVTVTATDVVSARRYVHSLRGCFGIKQITASS